VKIEDLESRFSLAIERASFCYTDGGYYGIITKRYPTKIIVFYKELFS